MPRIYWSSAVGSGDHGVGAGKSRWLAALRESAGRKELIRRWKFLDVNASVDPFQGGFRDCEPCLAMHSEAYVRSVVTGEPRELAESAGRRWTPELPIQAWAELLPLRVAALEVAHGRDDGTSGRLVGCLSGETHHARREAGRFGSVFNGIVSAALAALDSDVGPCRVQRVLLLDLDGDCAGGTASLIEGDSRIRLIDVAVCDRDAYAPSANASLEIVTDASHYLDAVRRALALVSATEYAGQLCIYSAGVDGVESAARGLPGLTASILAARDQLVFRWCLEHRIRTAFLLGGGESSDTVSRESLVALHRQTIDIAGQLVTAK
jgi:acetoin utilization deacetylase AcuC-like enzyme